MIDPDEEITPAVIQVYPVRWTILAVFCYLALCNGVLPGAFAPISNIAQNYFDGSDYNSATAINLFSSVFLILYPLGSVIGFMSLQYNRMRTTMILAGFLSAFGALLRYIGAVLKGYISLNGVYRLMLLGQCISGIAFPILANVPAALAAIWFPVEQRDAATTISSLFIPIGSAVGSLLPSLITTQSRNGDVNDDDHDTVHGMAELLLTECIMCVIGFIIALILFQDAPPTPPSISTRLKNERTKIRSETEESHFLFHDRSEDPFYHNLRQNSNDPQNPENIQPNATLIHEKPKSWRNYLIKSNGAILMILKTCWKLLQDYDFLILFLAFTLSLATMSAYVLMLNQILEPHGYSNGQAGILGAVSIFVGLLGSVVFGVWMGKTKAYKTILKFCAFFSCLTSWISFTCLGFGSFWLILAAAGFNAFFTLPLLPIMLETCAECCYPLPEELSIGLMHNGANALGAVLVFVIQYLLEQPALGPSPLLPSSLFIAGITTAYSILLFIFSGTYKRLQYDLINYSDEDEIRTETDSPNESLHGLFSPLLFKSWRKQINNSNTHTIVEESHNSHDFCS